MFFHAEMFRRLLDEEYEKLLQASDRDVHAVSKETTLPITREIVERYVLDETKAPWYIDLLNINLNNHDLQRARERIGSYMQTFKTDRHSDHGKPGYGRGSRTTMNSASFSRRLPILQQWMDSPRFKEITRLYSARQVAEQRGTHFPGLHRCGQCGQRHVRPAS